MPTHCKDADPGSFEVRNLLRHLRHCIDQETQTISIEEYIGIFKQLSKFFCLLGSVLGFVGNDIKQKLEVLDKYRKGPNKEHYETLQAMISFEEQMGIIKASKSSNPSGTRTFLRLHRALNFVSEFLFRVLHIQDEEAIGRICRQTYDATLAKYHGWFLKKGAYLAMFSLPKKKELYVQMCATGMERSEIDSLIPVVIDLAQKIYSKCEKMYREKNYLQLP